MDARRTSFLAIVILAVQGVGLAAEKTIPHGPKRFLDESLGFSVNKLGLQNALELRWTWPLSASASPLLADAHVSVGARPTSSRPPTPGSGPG
jgi:hypothetical protein